MDRRRPGAADRAGRGWSALLPGQEVRADGLLAPATRADLTVAVLRVRGAPHEVGPAPWWQTGAGALRDGLRAAAAVLPEAPAGLLPGLAVGDTRGLPDEVRDDFRAAGLSHLTAVSSATTRTPCARATPPDGRARRRSSCRPRCVLRRPAAGGGPEAAGCC